MAGITDYFTSVFSAAVCTAMVMYAFTRRKDGSRRIIFAVGAIVVVPVIVVVVIATQSQGQADVKNGWIVSLPVWLALVGVSWVAGMGWFGFARRVGDHPYCRKCGFDLFGKPAESTRCSECGADLAAKLAVVIGVRKRRRGLVATSIFLFFLGVLIGGRPAYQWATNVNWLRYEPMSMLINELSGPNVGNAESEVERRFFHNELSAGQVESLAKFTLAQRPGSRTGNLIGLPLNWMGTHDDLDETTARRLIQANAKSGSLFVVPTVARGIPIPFRTQLVTEFLYGDLFAGTTNQLHVQLAGVDLPAPTKKDENYAYERLVDPGEKLWPTIPDGPTQFVVHVDAVVHFRSRGQSFTEPVTAKFSCPTVVATGAAAEVPTTQPTAADLVAVWNATFGDPINTNDDSQGLQIDCSGMPTRVFARVFLIDAKGRQDIGLFDSEQHTFHAGPGYRRPSGDPHLELVPAPEETKNDWNPMPINNQTIRISDVRVVKN